jgi:hypothetical protein
MQPKAKIRRPLAYTLVLLATAGFLAGPQGTVLAKPLTLPLHGYGVYAGLALSNSLKFFFWKKISSFSALQQSFLGQKFAVKETEKPQSAIIAANYFCGAEGRTYKLCNDFNKLMKNK